MNRCTIHELAEAIPGHWQHNAFIANGQSSKVELERSSLSSLHSDCP